MLSVTVVTTDTPTKVSDNVGQRRALLTVAELIVVSGPGVRSGATAADDYDVGAECAMRISIVIAGLQRSRHDRRCAGAQMAARRRRRVSRR